MNGIETLLVALLWILAVFIVPVSTVAAVTAIVRRFGTPRARRFRDWDDGWIAGSRMVSGLHGADRHQNPHGGRR